MEIPTTFRRPRHIHPCDALRDPLTIRSRSLRTAKACLPGGVIIPAHRYLWYYEARRPQGDLVATIHLGEGVLPAGQDDLWRVVHRDGVSTLMSTTPHGVVPLASYFVGNAGLFNPIRRVTIGDDRTGGYDLHGKGWRGGWLTDADSGARELILSGEGDPPNVYHASTAKGARGVPLAAVLLLSYILIEREVRTLWVNRVGRFRVPPLDVAQASLPAKAQFWMTSR